MARYYSDMVNRRTCVYRAYDDTGRLLYVGLSMNPDGRFAKHRSSAWWPLADEITIRWFDDREAAKDEERAAIRDEGPIYNGARLQRPPKIRVVS